MTDLFGKSSPLKHTYTAQDIEVLEGLEPVRHRPGMYIGGTDSRAYHHLVAEILDNAMDEVVAGYAQHISIEIIDAHTIRIQDNGRGIPVDPHPKFPGKSALEVILTTLHSGGKFSNKAYKTSGGLHGVGLSVVNALSEKLQVTIFRDKKIYEQTYAQGKPQDALSNKAHKGNPAHGTMITFTPDTAIFGTQIRFQPNLLYKMARSKAYLFKGVEIQWKCASELIHDDTPSEEIFKFPNGIEDYLKEAVGDQATVIQKIFSGDVGFKDTPGKIEWAITWFDNEESSLRSYCNTILTPQGGTHETGFRQGLLKALKIHADRRGNKKASLLTSEDIFSGITGIISLFISNPQFQGQTKEKLTNTEVSRWVENAVKDAFDYWLSHQITDGDALLEYLIQIAEERKKRKAQKETARQSATKRLRLPGKLVDCTSEDTKHTELFLLEGDSAGGSAKQARDRNIQAILPLRGKILNVASASLEKLSSNQEIQDLALALGVNLGKHCNLDNLRYHKVIILTDADTDGAHIASLLLTFFFQQMRPLVENGHVYLACPPLYRVRGGNKSFYARDDEHKESILHKHFANNTKIEITRFKGLGEMDWQDLKATTMAPDSRTLLQVHLQDTDVQEDILPDFSHQLDQFIEDLMGRKPEKRFQFIKENAQFVKDLDV